MGITRDMNDLLVACNRSTKKGKYQVVVTCEYKEKLCCICKRYEVEYIVRKKKVNEEGKNKVMYVKDKVWYTGDILSTVLCLKDIYEGLNET